MNQCAQARTQSDCADEQAELPDHMTSLQAAWPDAQSHGFKEVTGVRKFKTKCRKIAKAKKLNACFYSQKLARETGLEPAASAVTGRRSNQLSYSRGCRNQCDPRRTEDLKASSALVKAVANLAGARAFPRCRCRKWPFYRQNIVVS